MTETTNSNPPSPPPSSRAIKFQYAASSPWAWVMKYVADLSPTNDIDSMMELESPSKMTSCKILQTEASVINTPSTSRHRRKKFPSTKAPSSEPQLSTVISLDVLEANTSKFIFAAHGTSFAFDGVDDKDELVRTLQRCRCDHLNISPPSLLLRWDLTREECTNLVGDTLPILPGNTKNVAVLKEPFGASGRGIHFVSSHEDIYNIIESHRKKNDTAASDETGLSVLDKIIAQKGRIPFWGTYTLLYRTISDIQNCLLCLLNFYDLCPRSPCLSHINYKYCKPKFLQHCLSKAVVNFIFARM